MILCSMSTTRKVRKKLRVDFDEETQLYAFFFVFGITFIYSIWLCIEDYPLVRKETNRKA